MDGLILILVVVAVIYYWGKSSGFKEGKKKGSEAAFGAGLLKGASRVTAKDKDGCIVLLISIVSFSVVGIILLLNLF